MTTNVQAAIAAKNEASVFQVKSGLAKLLATENIQVRHMPDFKTAAFDVKARQLFLPVWKGISDDLYDMLVVHEVGHALFTPADVWLDAVKAISKRSHGDKVTNRSERAVKLFMNVVEDARIDKLQKRKYPGSKKNYLVGYKELFDRNFFGIQGKNVNALTFIDRANIYFKGGLQNLQIQFSPDEKNLIKKMENLETFEEVIALTEEIYNLSKANSKSITYKSVEFDEDGEGDEWEIDENGDFTEIDGDEDEDAEDDDKVSSLSKESDDEEGKDSAEGEEGDDEEGDDTDLKRTENKESNRGGSLDDENIIPECETEDHAERVASSIVANDDYRYLYLTIPKFNTEHIVDDFKLVIPQCEASIVDKIEQLKARYRDEPARAKTRVQYVEDLNAWKSKERDTVNYMVKEFEMRKSADTYARQSVAKTGVIDTNKLHSYKFSDDIFRRLTVIPQGKNHGFVMVVDWSSSMHHQLHSTIKQLFSLVLFCKKVQIPFEVYTFRMPTSAEHYDMGNKSFNRYNGYDSNLSIKQFGVPQEGNLKFDAFKLRNVLSSRMNFSMLNRAYESLWIMSKVMINSDPMDSTPLNQAIVAMDTVINNFRVKNKLQIVSAIILTDGGSDPVSGIHVSAASKSTHKKGTKAIISDEITKKTYHLEGDTYYWGYKATEVFLNILRDRTGCNLIGFYLHHDRLNDRDNIPGVDPSYTRTNEAQEFWKKNKFIGVPTAGYDEYYIINANGLSSDSDIPLNVNADMSKKKIVNEFIKFFGKKSVNRVLLNRFIERIANERKRA